MADDSVMFNVLPAQIARPEERVLPTSGAKGSKVVSDRESGGGAGLDRRERSREERRREGEKIEEEAGLENLESEVAAGNRRLEMHGIPVRLRLYEEGETIHLEIEDRRGALPGTTRRVRDFSPGEIRKLIYDIMEEDGIIVDEVA